MNEYLLTINKFSRPGRKSTRPKTTLTLHWTQWPNGTAHQVRADWESKKDYTGPAKPFGAAHIVIDDTESLLCIPLDEVAYHCGVPIGNETSIGIELCVKDKEGTMSLAALDRAVEVCAELCRQFNIPPEKILRHYDWSKKVCPKWFVDHPDEFEQFKKDVKDLLRPA